MKSALMILVFLTGISLQGFAQIEDFLSSQVAVQSGNSIDLSWSIALGNTCLGTTVERAINGGPFTNVYGIGGICGSPEREETYRFRDEGLTETGEYHYKISFGNLGHVSLFVQFVQVWESGISVYPVMGSRHHMLRVESLTGTYDLEIFDSNGNLVHILTTLNLREVTLPSSSWTNGVYIALLRSRDNLIKQKFAIFR